MMRDSRLEHRFVKHVPENVEPGCLYVSMEYGTVVHSCCCGCGEEVVTPLTPTDWKLTFDGETVTLYPSIGNWSLPCRSHYIINRGRVIEAGPWSDKQVAAERARDRAAKAGYYGVPPGAVRPEPVSIEPGVPPDETGAPGGGFLHRLWQSLRDPS
jgi:hypothetical protein